MPCVRVGIVSGVFITRKNFFYYQLPVQSGHIHGGAEVAPPAMAAQQGLQQYASLSETRRSDERRIGIEGMVWR